MWRGKRYAYRQVRWTPEQCEKANIVANKAGGDWDIDILANEFDMPDLLDWGFDDVSDIFEAISAAEISSVDSKSSNRAMGDKKKQTSLSSVLGTSFENSFGWRRLIKFENG